MKLHSSAAPPLIPNALATKAGLLPLRRGPVRFAVGPPDGLTSNSWRLWTTRRGDIYIACRDNFKEAKVSLHASGRWRMGFTTEALMKDKALLANDKDRAWEVWDEPPPTLPDTVVAFRLLFPNSELAVRPEQRSSKEWKQVIFIEAAPPGKLTVAKLFVTSGDRVLGHVSEPSVCLASLDIGENRRAQLVLHTDPEGDFPQFLAGNVAKARAQTELVGVEIPNDAYGYFFGNRSDGSRFLVGARIDRS
jgi:hypothetical protein